MMKWMLVVLLAGSAWAQTTSTSTSTTTTTVYAPPVQGCSGSVARLTPDARTCQEKIPYRLCHSEVPMNNNIQTLWDNLGVSMVCAALPAPVAADDNVLFPMASYLGAEIVAIGCKVSGTCGTPPTFDIQDNDGTVISPTSTPTCATANAAITFQTTTDSDRFLAAGETPKFSVTNTPSCDFFMPCILVKEQLDCP